MKNYTSAYHTFKSVWLDTYREIKGTDHKQHSDDFTRQDFIVSLFLGDTCVALDCLRFIDLRNPVEIDDTWFADWKNQQLDSLVEENHSNCLVNSNFTVHKDFRKYQYQDLHIAHIMGCLATLYQLELEAPIMLGMTRNNRSMDKLNKLWGGSIIEEDILHNGISTDLVAFYPKNLREVSLKYPKMVFEIFNRKKDFCKEKINEKVA